MKLSIFSTLLLSSLAFARGDKGQDDPTQPANGAQPKHGGGGGGGGRGRASTPCDQFIHAEFVVKVNSNKTEMDRIEAKNPTRAQRLQAENANATALMHQLEANSTFVKECQTYEVRRHLDRDCNRLRHLEQAANDSTNSTRQADAKNKLAELQKNQTLVNDCKNQQSGSNGGKGATGNDL
jgi:hypothetical protein